MNPSVIFICFVVFFYNMDVSGNENSAKSFMDFGLGGLACPIKVDSEVMECTNSKAITHSDKHKNDCCKHWVSFDCLKKIGQEKCSKEEYEKGVTLTEATIKDKCKDYPFGTKMCTELNQESVPEKQNSGQTLFSITSLVFISFALSYILQ